VLCARDITERVEAYEALRRSDERLSALLRHSSDVVVVVSADGSLSYISPSAHLVLGYPPGSHLGTKLMDFVHPDDRVRVRDALTERLLSNERVTAVELRVAHADGSWRILELVATNRIDDPVVGGIVCNLRDITDLRRAQDETIRNARRFEAMLANLSDLVSVIDADGQMIYLSPATLRILGRHAEDRLGASIFDFIHPDDKARTLGEFARARERAGLIGPFDTRVLHQDGAYRTFEVRANNLLDDPAVNGIIVSSRDVTERVHSDAALRAAELARHQHEAELARHRLEAELIETRRLESLGRLAAGVAHDFNNLLGVILNYASAAAHQVDAASSAGRDIARIRQAAEQATDVTRKLLTFGRADAVNVEDFDLNELVRDITQLVDRSFGAEISVTNRLSPGPCCVHADRGQIEQMLMNLLLNARDAIVDRGTVLVATELTAPTRSGAKRAEVVLTVADTGSGMSAEVLRRAFEPFFTTKPAERGTGLGLSTAHAVATRAGGHIAIESDLGVGTTVRVRLPGCASPAPSD
jgi:PAS domain S-box-containing protein